MEKTVSKFNNLPNEILGKIYFFIFSEEDRKILLESRLVSKELKNFLEDSEYSPFYKKPLVISITDNEQLKKFIYLSNGGKKQSFLWLTNLRFFSKKKKRKHEDEFLKKHIKILVDIPNVSKTNLKQLSKNTAKLVFNYDNEFNNKALEFIVQKFPRIESLTIRGCKNINREGYKWFTELTQLQTVNFEYCVNIDHEVLGFLSPTVTTLMFNSCNFEKVAVLHFLEENNQIQNLVNRDGRKYKGAQELQKFKSDLRKDMGNVYCPAL
jgi:hypothetical protein